ncbi:uncharacterized protein LOC9662590 isoform X1 [Selaginella moellendorffii]|uniref:uncharacterized protein LOC9662590 isoform X1 n=1 Tax=Selaginella moellendorffii TaxID=88036 RepID=UPI000D1CF8E7|nr:uncharacterized protein LOC9662590 isoform X1 [Selaginella moellendorffii]|eukprot:XP_024516348.1 uncharacterized protein LOC9662590 isoform X1 [Selaginella moellendorffii]
MERARSTLEDFCRSYFMFHGLDERHVFKHLPILMFVEAFIYQLDDQNENAIQLSGSGALGADPFLALRQVLMNKNLLTERIEKELEDGVEYWLLERTLCKALSSSSSSEISASDVLRAVRLKSFDYRVLNLLLYRLRDEEVNEVHFNFLKTSELLVEISDDLYVSLLWILSSLGLTVFVCWTNRYDYEEDVVDNSFNILRMFVSLYGAKTAPAKLASLISEIEREYENLVKQLEPGLAARYQKRCEEAVKEGGSNSKHLLGCWTIPHIIQDEAAYRSSVNREAIEAFE